MLKESKIFFLTLMLVCVSAHLMGQKYSMNPYETRQPMSWTGTGWLLNNGYVVTNHHVADNARSIILKFPTDQGWNEYSAEIKLLDEENDLAILYITDSTFNGLQMLPYALKTSLADVGEEVFVLGYPMTTTMGDEIKLTNGIISSHSGFQGSSAQYQISAPVQPGNSGGPLFDNEGNIIGVINAKHAEAENVGYAIKASYLSTLLEKLPNFGSIIPSSNEIAHLSLPEQVKRIKKYVCFIQCSNQVKVSQYDAPIIPYGDKVVVLPYVDFCHDANARIEKVILSDKETIIELSCNNLTENGYFDAINIQRETYIVANGRKYQLVRAEGIAIAPKKTTYSNIGETKYFKLIFPTIPKSTTSINLIEPNESTWIYYGILLKD